MKKNFHKNKLTKIIRSLFLTLSLFSCNMDTTEPEVIGITDFLPCIQSINFAETQGDYSLRNYISTAKLEEDYGVKFYLLDEENYILFKNGEYFKYYSSLSSNTSVSSATKSANYPAQKYYFVIVNPNVIASRGVTVSLTAE